jgi:hypothetical protein
MRLASFTSPAKSARGFDTKMLIELRCRLDALPARPGLFKSLPLTIVAKTAHWVEPHLVPNALRGVGQRWLAAASRVPRPAGRQGGPRGGARGDRPGRRLKISDYIPRKKDPASGRGAT